MKPAASSERRAPVADPTQQLKIRARRRLIGAVVLVLTAIVVLPMLLDSKPRPVNPNVPIEIPAKNTTFTPQLEKAAAPAAASTASTTATSAAATSAASEAVAASTPTVLVNPTTAAAATPPALEAKPETKVEIKPKAPAETKTEAKPETKAQAQPASKPEVKAESKVETKPAETKPGKWVVQVAAYGDDAKAQQWVKKLKSAGFKAYTEKVQTASGTRIRVRAGPYASQAEANRALEKIKNLGASEARLASAT